MFGFGRETNHVIVKAIIENIVLSALLAWPWSKESNKAVGCEFHRSDLPSWDLPHAYPNSTPNSNSPEFVPGTS